jgi:hypothetical protein
MPVHNSTNEVTLFLEAWVLNDLAASMLCNIGCSEWHGCTGMHKSIQLANQRLYGTQAMLFCMIILRLVSWLAST